MATRCTHCGERSWNQAPGNGCHTCLIGVMREEPAQLIAPTRIEAIDPDKRAARRRVAP